MVISVGLKVGFSQMMPNDGVFLSLFFFIVFLILNFLYWVKPKKQAELNVPNPTGPLMI